MKANFLSRAGQSARFIANPPAQLGRNILARMLVGAMYTAAPKASFGMARRILATYDSAMPSRTNDAHWADADAFAATVANNPQARALLRRRARHECANNCYANGMEETLANDIIGTGPRLHVVWPNRKTARAIEKRFASWAKEVKFVDKLRLACKAEFHDGESFILFASNKNSSQPVKLDMISIEADQIAAWSSVDAADPMFIGDGVALDEFGRPSEYRVLKYHPGGFLNPMLLTKDIWTDYPAERMLHDFNSVRPGQIRGIPEIAPALPIFAQLRRFTLATLEAAETAANVSAVMKTNADFYSAEVQTGATPWDTMPTNRGSIMVLPDGYDMQQFKAEHPMSSYAEFKEQLLAEAARTVCMPFNIAAGNSSAHNKASAQFDGGIYERAIEVKHSRSEEKKCSPTFRLFMKEALLADEKLKKMCQDLQDYADNGLEHVWRWPSFSHTDPTKDANASAARLDAGITTLERECGDEGEDWVTVVEQQGVEREKCLALGLPDPFAKAVKAPAPAPGGEGTPPAK